MFKVYFLFPAEQLELNTFLSENFYTGWICPFKSSMAIPIFFIKKKDSFLQLVQNYRSLNIVTVKNKYPLSLISKLVSQLQKAKYFIKLNVCWGFNNVQIKPGYKSNHSLFKLLVMFLNMTNSLATFLPELRIMDFIYFPLFFIVDQRWRRQKVTLSHVTVTEVTCSHDMMEQHRRF